MQPYGFSTTDRGTVISRSAYRQPCPTTITLLGELTTSADFPAAPFTGASRDGGFMGIAFAHLRGRIVSWLGADKIRFNTRALVGTRELKHSHLSERSDSHSDLNADNDPVLCYNPLILLTSRSIFV